MICFKNAIARLEQKGFSPVEAAALVNTIRACEDYVVATKLQAHVNKTIPETQDPTLLGNKLARIFKFEDIGFLIEQASINTPSPNQMPPALAKEVALLSQTLFQLQEDCLPVKDNAAFFVQHFNQEGQATKGK